MTPAIGELLMQAMEDAGYDVAAVGSVSGAIGLCTEEVLDLVLVDISPPGTDGQRAAGRLRRDRRLGMLPIVAITAPITAAQRAARAPAASPRWKPGRFDGSRLRRTIQTLLRERVRRGEGPRC